LQYKSNLRTFVSPLRYKPISNLMKKNTLLLLIVLFASLAANAQKYTTKTGTIKFFSDSPLEKIQGINHQVNSALDYANGNFVFRVLILGFEFEKPLMQEHFRENYMESEKFPNATFSGKITNIKEVNITKDGIYKVTVEGDLNIHGVTKKVIEKGTLEVKAGKIIGKSVMNVSPKDFDIKIPAAVIKNIAETIQVDVNVSLEKFGS